MENTEQVRVKYIRKKFALELDEKNLTSLINLVEEYYPECKMQIGATLKDNSAKEFSNLGELLEHDNHGSSRIVALVLLCDGHYKFVFTGQFTRKEFFVITTVRIEFKIAGQEKYTLFLDRLEKALKQMKLAPWNTIALNACLPLTTFLCFIAVYWFFVVYLELPFEISVIFIAALIICGLAFAITVICKHLWQTLFAPVHFLYARKLL